MPNLPRTISWWGGYARVMLMTPMYWLNVHALSWYIRWSAVCKNDDDYRKRGAIAHVLLMWEITTVCRGVLAPCTGRHRPTCDQTHTRTHMTSINTHCRHMRCWSLTATVSGFGLLVSTSDASQHMEKCGYYDRRPLCDVKGDCRRTLLMTFWLSVWELRWQCACNVMLWNKNWR